MHSPRGLLPRVLSLPGAKHFTLLLAQRFIAGTTVVDLLVKKIFLNSVGFSVIVNFLGESSLNFKDIKLAGAKYLGLISFFGKINSPEEISLKASEFGLGPYCDPICYSWWDDCPEIMEVLENADEAGFRLWLDAELLDVREELWKFASRVLEKISFLGIAYQAYGDRGFNSEYFFEAVVRPLIESLEKGKTLGLRLCKGAYFSSERWILRDQKKIRERYLVLASSMIKLAIANNQDTERGDLFLEFATHDPYLIEELKKMAKRFNLPKNKFRFAMLLGRQQTLASHLLAEGYRVFIYTPFGPDKISYICRRLQENWKHLLFLFRREGKYHDCSYWPESCSLNA